MLTRPHLFGIALLLGACGSPPPPPPPPQPTATPAATKPPPEKTKPAPPPEPEKPKTTAPRLPDVENHKRPELPAVFAAVTKSFADKDFDGALTELDKLDAERKRGKLAKDEEMLMWALMGHSLVMQNKLEESQRAFRRILPLWGNWRQEEKNLMRLEEDEAKGKARVALAVDAAGEGLFHLAEKKRQQAETLEMPVYDGNGDPKDVGRWVKGPLKSWVQRRTQKVKSAAQAYDMVQKLGPEPPPRWLPASASRVGAMYGMMVEGLRKVPFPAAWKEDGKSDYKDPTKGEEPLEWKAIREDFRSQINELMDPLLETAKEAYGTCNTFGSQHSVTDEFTKSCAEWLSAN